MNNIKDSGFILPLEQYNKLEVDIYKYCILNTKNYLTLSTLGLEPISFSNSSFLISKSYKPGNIILIPYYLTNIGYILTPFQILEIFNNKTYFFSKNVLFDFAIICTGESFHRIHLFNTEYEKSEVRKYLNSDAFLNLFPEIIQDKISFNEIYSEQKILKDRFWLPSSQELGMAFFKDNNNYNIIGTQKGYIKLIDDFPSSKPKFLNIFNCRESLYKHNFNNFVSYNIDYFNLYENPIVNLTQYEIEEILSPKGCLTRTSCLIDNNKYKNISMKFNENTYHDSLIAPAFYLNN